jgi:hypothetical protein
MHFQHPNKYSLALLNFRFLPQILQQHLLISNSFFVGLKNILLSVVATIPNRPILQTTAQIHGHLYYSLVEPFFPDDKFNLFQIVGSRPDSIYLQLKGAVYFWFVIWVNLFL